MLAIAMAAMVPSDNAISGSSDKGGENVERASKVRPTMHQKERRVRFGTPFVDRKINAISIVAIRTGWAFSAGVGASLRSHEPYRLEQSPSFSLMGAYYI